uniref:Ig-like domain-containing protein n=1 Tax=Salarias fasciatus TaxID=181472 RepID=A0A672G937_SALFA
MGCTDDYSLHLFFLFSLPGSEVIRKIVNEDQDALLSCALDGTNIAKDVFDWKMDGSSNREVFYYTKGSHYLNGLPGQDVHFKDRVFHFTEQLAVGNASIVITKTQVTDSGNYTFLVIFCSLRTVLLSLLQTVEFNFRAINVCRVWLFLQT